MNVPALPPPTTIKSYVGSSTSDGMSIGDASLSKASYWK